MSPEERAAKILEATSRLLDAWFEGPGVPSIIHADRLARLFISEVQTLYEEPHQLRDDAGLITGNFV